MDNGDIISKHIYIILWNDSEWYGCVHCLTIPKIEAYNNPWGTHFIASSGYINFPKPKSIADGSHHLDPPCIHQRPSAPSGEKRQGPKQSPAWRNPSKTMFKTIQVATAFWCNCSWIYCEQLYQLWHIWHRHTLLAFPVVASKRRVRLCRFSVVILRAYCN